MLTGRVVKPGEPYWTDTDTALALALLHEEQMTCDGCGQDRRESMDKANEYAYTVEPVRCHSCAARDAKAESFDGRTHGLNWITTRREVSDG